MNFANRSDAWSAVQADYADRPGSAKQSLLGDQMIVQPAGAQLLSPAFYILGVNGGETPRRQDEPVAAHTRSTDRWFEICRRAAEAVGARTWIITERCHWGSPDVPTLLKRVGSKARLRELLRLHAEANLAMFCETSPLLVWVTGFSFLAETIDDYALTLVGEPQRRTLPQKGVLWREFVAADGVPFLVSRHPTGARAAKGEHDRVFEKLASMSVRGRSLLAD